MNLSPEGQKLYEKLVAEMLADGFERVSEHTFYQRLGHITVSLSDHALNLIHRGKLYGIIPERELLKLSNGFDPVLTQLKYLLAFAIRQDMNRLMNFFSSYFLN